MVYGFWKLVIDKWVVKGIIDIKKYTYVFYRWILMCTCKNCLIKYKYTPYSLIINNVVYKLYE